MNKFENEKIMDALTEIDPQVLTKAYEIDDAAKLKVHCRKQFAPMRKVIALAACLALALCIWQFWPVENNKSGGTYTLEPMDGVNKEDANQIGGKSDGIGVSEEPTGGVNEEPTGDVDTSSASKPSEDETAPTVAAQSAIYASGTRSYELRPDGTFVYSKNGQVVHSGTYVIDDNCIQLYWTEVYQGMEIMGTTSYELTETGGFDGCEPVIDEAQ